jgi:hypothetical protein
MICNAHASLKNSDREHHRSLLVHEWPEVDRRAWEDACRPGSRLKPGGAASYLAQASRDDFARRYGAFLGFLQRTEGLDHGAAPAAQVTVENVGAYIADLKVRVRSVTIWNCVYKLRRAAELLAPIRDFSWLAEIEKDSALVAEPRSKFDRLVLTGRLVEAGLTLVAEAQCFARNDLSRARGIRNGLMIALLALCPVRLKNFAALEFGRTFREVHGTWWIALPSIITKSRRPDERAVPALLNPAIHAYLSAPLSARFSTGHKCTLDLFHEETAADCEKPGNTNLKNNPADRWRGRVTSPVPHRCSLNCSSIRRERTAFGQLPAQSHRSARHRGAL